MNPAIADEIKPAALDERLRQNKIDLLDVRSPQEYQAEHIPAAASNPVQMFDIGNLPEDRQVAVYCASSRRPGQAAGHKQVAVLKDRLATWKQAGYGAEGISIRQTK